MKVNNENSLYTLYTILKSVSSVGDASIMKVKLFEKAQEGNSPIHPSADDSQKARTEWCLLWSQY